MKIRSNSIELVDVNSLVPHPKNCHDHPKEQIERLAKIIEYQGFRSPLTVQAGTNLIVTGHGRLMAAKKLGMKEVPVTYQEFESDEQLYAHLVADNAIGKDTWATLDLSTINMELENLGPDLDIDMLGLKDFVIEPFEKLEPGSDEDEVPEVVDPITKRGDIWLLGDHRVMCGDSTMIDDVEKLMNGEKADMVFTDPPYGMNYQLNATKNKLNKIKNDSEPFDIYEVWSIFPKTKHNSPVYICTRFDKYVDWQNQIHDKVKNCIVWAKSNMGAGDLKNYGYQHEFIMYWGESIDGKRDSNLWSEGNTPKSEYVSHPTQKPISLVERAIENHKLKSVYDCFLGSGSTLIACEKSNRKCYGMELDEHYCDVIINRWQNYTDKEATLESTGEKYNELKQKAESINENKTL